MAPATGAVQLLNVVPADQPALRVAHQIDLLAPVVASELLDMLGQYASEKHYGDACVDAEQLDEMIGELEPPTRNLSGTLPNASDNSLPSKVKEPFVFYGVHVAWRVTGRSE